MKKFYSILLTFLAINIASATNYYVAPLGNDANAGTIGSPFRTWQKGASVLVAGDTCFIRGGRYLSPLLAGASDWLVTIANRNGTSANPIVISAYPGEQPVLDLTGFNQTNNTTVIRVNKCTSVKFIGLWVKNVVQNAVGNIIAGWEFHECTDITMDRCWVDNIGGAGIRQAIKNGLDVINNDRFTYINCDASRCHDSISTGGGAYGNADGFDCNLGTATYINCRAWWNSDDGFDCFNNDAFVTYTGCWSFRNGFVPGTFSDPGAQADGMGFKYGRNLADLSTTHLRNYNNCISFDNKAWGFDQNVARCIAWFYNNTSYRNRLGGWATGYSLTPRVNNVLRNNVSYLDPITVSDFTGITNDHNTWNPGLAASGSSFASLDTTGVIGSRAGDGSLPSLSFLHLSSGSNLIDKGIVQIGVSFCGVSQDLGAFEACGTTTIPNLSGGLDQLLTLPTNTVTLSATASANSPATSITYYSWTKESGPSSYNIVSPTNQTTEINNLTTGVYTFKVTATDNLSSSNSDLVQVTVNGGNAFPEANAGTDITITAPTASVHLSGGGTDPDGSIYSYSWAKLSGPVGETIVTPTTAGTDVNGLAPGTYVFRLTVTDNSGGTDYDDITVTVRSYQPGQRLIIQGFRYSMITTGDSIFWTTQNEQGIKSFSIQQSADGSTWTDIASKPPGPGSYKYFIAFKVESVCVRKIWNWCIQKKNSYVVTHYYYRLKAVDSSNVSIFSEAIKT